MYNNIFVQADITCDACESLAPASFWCIDNQWMNQLWRHTCDLYIWTRNIHTYAQHKYSTKRSQHVNKLVTWNTWDTNAWEPTVAEFTKATIEKKKQRNWKKTKISTFLVDYDDLADGQPTAIAYCVLCLQYENNENLLYASLQISFLATLI